MEKEKQEKIYKKKVLFIGMPDMALVCLDKLARNGINIVGVVPPAKNEPTRGLLINLAKMLNLNIIEYERSLYEKDFLKKIKDLKADIGVVASYNKKFPKELLSLTKDGFINLHPSKLPYYRGSNPYSHVIINGETESAITLHFMDEGFDTGDIISQYRFSLSENETMGSLFFRTNEMCASMLFEALDFYEEAPFPHRPQPKTGEFPTAETLSFEKRNTFIDWSKSAEEIERFIRALNPFIGAVTYYRNYILRINSARVINKKHDLTAGSIISCNHYLRIACGKDILEISSLQYGGFFIGSARDFIERLEPKKGEMLTSG